MTSEAEIRRVLAALSQECYSAATHDRSADESDVLAVLERLLLPILEAGQAMRDHIRHFPLTKVEAVDTWDAALQAATKGAGE